MIAPDSTILIDYMLNRLTRLIKNLVVYEDAMAINLDRLKGLIFSQQVLLALIAKECARQEAYSLTQRISLKAWNTGQSFKQLLLDDPAIRNYLDEAEIGELFSLDYHLKHVEEIFARVFQQ